VAPGGAEFTYLLGFDGFTEGFGGAGLAGGGSLESCAIPLMGDCVGDFTVLDGLFVFVITIFQA